MSIRITFICCVLAFLSAFSPRLDAQDMKERFDFKWGRDRGAAFERMLMEIGGAHGIFFTFEMGEEPCVIPKDYLRKSLQEQLQYLSDNCPDFVVEKSLLQNKLYHVISRALLMDPAYPINQSYRLKQDNVSYNHVERAMQTKTHWRTVHNIRAVSKYPARFYVVNTTKGVLSYRDILSLTSFNTTPAVRWSVWANVSRKQMQIGFMESPPESVQPQQTRAADKNIPAAHAPSVSDLVEPVETSPAPSAGKS